MALLLAIALIADPTKTTFFLITVVVALVFGVMLVLPIGGADMPTVISLLNSYAGFSAALLGFVLNNKVLIVAGALDGSSGFILSVIMCKAMNRSFTNVMFGAFGQVQTSGQSCGRRENRAQRIARKARYCRHFGRGEQWWLSYQRDTEYERNTAQHKVRELYDILTKKGVDVKFGIHPVAGRMPGHMNVLLAEADIPYERLVEMEDINSDIPQTDVALITAPST